MNYSTLYQSIDELHKAFEMFKEANDERLKMMEKGNLDPLVQEKLTRIEQSMDHLQSRIQKIDTTHLQKRPIIGTTSAQETVYQKAFQDYLRKGYEQELRLLEKKSFNAFSKEEGGYLLPENIITQIYSKEQGYGVMRNHACVVETQSHQYDLVIESGSPDPLWGLDEISKHQKEGTKTSNLTRLSIPLHTLFDLPQLSSALIDDVQMNLEQWLIEEIGKRLVRAENAAFFSGNDGKKPKGILSYETNANPSAEQFQSISTGVTGKFSAENPENTLINLIYSLKPEYHSKAIWMMARSTLAEVRKMKTPDGHYIWHPPLSSDLKTHTLLGYPVVLCDEMPSLNPSQSTNPIVFGDFYESYLIVDRGGVMVQRDQFTCKPNIQLLISKRVGGAVRNFDALKFISCSE
jgi:HK97 family phage major capsid protein